MLESSPLHVEENQEQEVVFRIFTAIEGLIFGSQPASKHCNGLDGSDTEILSFKLQSSDQGSSLV